MAILVTPRVLSYFLEALNTDLNVFTEEIVLFSFLTEIQLVSVTCTGQEMWVKAIRVISEWKF